MHCPCKLRTSLSRMQVLQTRSNLSNFQLFAPFKWLPQIHYFISSRTHIVITHAGTSNTKQSIKFPLICSFWMITLNTLFHFKSNTPTSTLIAFSCQIIQQTPIRQLIFLYRFSFFGNIWSNSTILTLVTSTLARWQTGLLSNQKHTSTLV